ncbi:MAG TPA: amino acid permease, partial [Gammaproteobacteria bacterium]|nr:amino acid permease [Gammaproteobacteria bacterium]
MIQPKRVLGTFTLAMITVAAIISLRNLPLSAEFGLSSIFYFVVAALVFFIPIALTTAELATGWPRAGGNYVWVSEAFGKPVGFFSLWTAWMESIAWFPAILAFTGAMLAHLLTPLFPGLEHN